MPYILNKTNGTIVATVEDASLDLTTDLIFLGRNYAGYGEVQNENFLKLLENFSNTTPPLKPIEGQLWFDSYNKKINVYDNLYWKTVANLEVGVENSSPTVTKDPTTGDLWFNTSSEQLTIFNGTEYIVVGPPVGSDTKAQWKGDFEYNETSLNLPVYNIKAVIGSGNEVVAIVSNETYTMPDYSLSDTSPDYPVRTEDFTKIVKGITLSGADPITGSTRKEITGLSDDLYFWGTSAESRFSLYATTATYALGLSCQPNNINASFYVPFVNSTATTSVAFTNTNLVFNPHTGILDTTASAALYADIAERYEADAIYEYGTVLVIGGTHEVTTTEIYADTRVIGVVSKNPAYMMNSGAGTDETHPYIALRGRVPCKVVGTVNRGDLLVSSKFPGYAAACNGIAATGTIIGKALGKQSEGFGMIEILVV
jgi:hypothetical protein